MRLLLLVGLLLFLAVLLVMMASGLRNLLRTAPAPAGTPPRPDDGPAAAPTGRS
jgi:hypothetical protein